MRIGLSLMWSETRPACADVTRGNRRLYELNPGGVEALRAYFDRFWNHALESFKRAAEIKEER